MDEYSANTGIRGDVREGPNVARIEDKRQVPWRHWLERRVSGIGVYEGADGRAKGAFKPTTDCIMDVGTKFCPICREQLLLQIYRRVDPIDGDSPPAHASPHDAIKLSADTSIRDQEPIVFSVDVMQPKSHSLQARWYLLASDEEPRTLVNTPPSLDRRRRGPLPIIDSQPVEKGWAKKGKSRFEFLQRKTPPGLYRVVCRVVDTTKVRGERYPWVLKDEHGVLESQRVWWIHIE